MNEKYFSYTLKLSPNYNITTLYHIILTRKKYVLIQSVLSIGITPRLTEVIKLNKKDFENWYNECKKYWSVEEFKVEHL